MFVQAQESRGPQGAELVLCGVQQKECTSRRICLTLCIGGSKNEIHSLGARPSFRVVSRCSAMANAAT